MLFGSTQTISLHWPGILSVKLEKNKFSCLFQVRIRCLELLSTSALTQKGPRETSLIKSTSFTQTTSIMRYCVKLLTNNERRKEHYIKQEIPMHNTFLYKHHINLTKFMNLVAPDTDGGMKSCTQAVNCGVVKSTSIPLHNM
jgi:hypothetical protein